MFRDLIVDARDKGILEGLVWSSDWMTRVLMTVRDAHIPDAWVGAGALRDLVWGERFGDGFDPARVRDVDVAYFDPHDLRRANDDRVTQRLCDRWPAIPWEARNQAAVHTWYSAKFGGDPVPPLVSIPDAIGTWPETATAVAVRLDADNRLEVCAPHGLTDLLDGIWRPNPTRITPEQSRERLARHQPDRRWPTVRVIPPN
jgi:hypothetical protein